MPQTESTRVERWVRRAKDHKAVSIVILCGIVLIGIGAVADALLNLEALLFGGSPKQDERAGRAALTLSIYDVALDDKGRVMASNEFVAESSGLTDALLSEAVGWIEKAMPLPDDLPDATVTLRVPGDWKTGDRETSIQPGELAGRVSYFVRYDAGGGKARVRSSEGLDSLATVPEGIAECDIEVRVPGYEIGTIRVHRGETLEETRTLRTRKIRIGVEEFAGPAPEATGRFIGQLSAHPTATVVNPDVLDRIREQIQAHNRQLAANPQIQDSIRKLGVDYILTGSVRMKQPVTD